MPGRRRRSDGNRIEETETRQRAGSEQHESGSPLRPNRVPEIEAGHRNEQQEVDGPVGEVAPDPGPEPVAAQIRVVGSWTLVQVGDRFERARPAARHGGGSRCHVDVYDGFNARLRNRNDDSLSTADVANEADLALDAGLIDDPPR